MKSLHAKAAKSTFVTSEKNAYLSLSLYTSLWKIENRIYNNIVVFTAARAKRSEAKRSGGTVFIHVTLCMFVC